MSKRIAIFDADVLAFRASAAAEQRKVEVTHSPSNKTKVFKTRTEFKDYLKLNDFEFNPDDYVFRDIQIAEEVHIPMKVLKHQILNIQDELWADEIKLFISGQDNFRDSLPLPSKYKGQRTDSIKPLLLKSCRSYLKNYHGARTVNGHETDDALIYTGYEYLKKGYEVIIVTNDKDANAYSGLMIYNYTEENPKVLEIPQLGFLRIDEKTKKLKGQGFLWYCAQMLIGDVVDNYKPTELTDAKFGDASAFKILKDCTSEQEALSVVISKYKEWYPKSFVYTDWSGKQIESSWEHMLNLYHSCARMMETRTDSLIAYDFFKRYGVELK